MTLWGEGTLSITYIRSCNYSDKRTVIAVLSIAHFSFKSSFYSNFLPNHLDVNSFCIDKFTRPPHPASAPSTLTIPSFLHPA